MQTLEELRSKISVLPSLFAGESGAISPAEGESPNMNFGDGFPIAYSQNPQSDAQGRYIQRNDFNRFGEIASREALFKECGGVHTFSQKVSQYFKGYPQDAVLTAYDGTYLAKVESTESANTKPFYDEERKTLIPNVIDCPVTDDDDSEGTPSRVLWKSVGWIYGAEEGLFHLDLDYTRLKMLSPSGGIIDEDSLVIGMDCAIITGESAKTAASVKALLPISYETHIVDTAGNGVNWTMTNKGKCGVTMGHFPILWFTTATTFGVEFKLPYIGVTGGTGNYALSFFAKAGSTFSGQHHIYKDRIDILSHPEFNDKYYDQYINWVAIPIKATVRASGEEGKV